MRTALVFAVVVVAAAGKVKIRLLFSFLSSGARLNFPLRTLEEEREKQFPVLSLGKGFSTSKIASRQQLSHLLLERFARSGTFFFYTS